MVKLNEYSPAEEIKPLELGDYIAKINDFEQKTSQSGRPIWSIPFEVKTEGQKRRVFDTFVLDSEPSCRRLVSILIAVGIDPKKNPNREYIPEDIIGEELIITLDRYEKNDKGQEFPRIAFVGFKKLETNNYEKETKKTAPKAKEPELINEEEIPF